MTEFRDREIAQQLYERALDLEDNGEMEAAIEHHERAVKADPEFADAHVGLGYLHLRLGDDRRAVRSLRKAVRVADHPLAYYNLGWIYEGREEFERAEELYRRALAIDPTLVDAHLGLASALLNRGRVEEAESSIRRALELDPQNVYGLGLRDEVLPRYAEFGARAAGKLTMKEEIYLDLGAVCLGTAGDDGIEIPRENNRAFAERGSLAATLARFLALADAFDWRWDVVVSADEESDPLALALAKELDLDLVGPDEVNEEENALVVSAALGNVREYLDALDALDEAGAGSFRFILSLPPRRAAALDARSLPQAVGLRSDGSVYWRRARPVRETGASPPGYEAVAGEILEALRAAERDANAPEQAAWYGKTHPHVNFKLQGL